MTIKLIVLCILLAAPFALWGALCALNAVDIRSTRPGIAAGFLLCVIGWGALIAAGLDYLVGDAPLFWPLVLLLGVLLLSIGNAAIYLLNRRRCGCPSCPGRVIHLKELRHG
jgi:hypothetical protein